MNDRNPPPNSPLARHIQNVKDAKESYSDVRATFGDSLELHPLEDGRVELQQRTGCGDAGAKIKLNYVELVWLKKHLERICG